MLRALRKYNKIILVIGGSILMVIFLLPSAVTQMGRNVLATTVGTYDGGKITVEDTHNAGREISIVGEVSPNLLQALHRVSNSGAAAPGTIRAEHWILLTEEARAAGLVGGPRDAREEVPEQRATALSSQFGPKVFETALAHYKGVMRLIDSVNPSLTRSTQEMVSFGQELFDTATVGVVLIPGDTAAKDAPAPTEEELTAHFEKYRDVSPAEDPNSIGYRRPPAVQLEWFVLDRPTIEAAFVPDPVEVNKHYQQNRERFSGTFAEVRNLVESAYEQQQVTQALDRASDVIKRELFRSTANLPADGVFKTLPPDWSTRMPNMATLAAAGEAELKKAFPTLGGATSVSTGDETWRSATDLGSIAGIGRSALPLNNNFLPFSVYAFAVRELKGDARLGVQQGLVYGPLEDFQGSRYYFRITAVREEGPPASLDEVRDQVVKNVQTLKGVDLLRQQAQVYKDRAAADGLAALGNSLTIPVRWGIEVTPQMVRSGAGSTVPDPLLDSPEVRDAVLALARQIDPRVPAEEIDAAERTLAVVAPKAGALAVIQITRWRPMTTEQFRTNMGRIAGHAARDSDIIQLAVEPFSFQSVSARMGYKPAADFAAQQEDPEAAEPATEPAPKPAAQPAG
ncbi:MAG: hypothetical protein SFZ24_06780 [Planctomycetota bacterium]|nr:hypothetical protein [Planctomycetota bacterium]